MAWITRANLTQPGDMSMTIGHHNTSASYKIDPNANLPEWFTLAPGESKQARIRFQIPPGPYQLVVGLVAGSTPEYLWRAMPFPFRWIATEIPFWANSSTQAFWSLHLKFA